MPDDATATIATEAPAEPSADAPVTEPAAEVAAETTTTTEPDIWTRVLELDPDELVRKHPRLAGKVGDLADKRTRKTEEALRQKLREEIQAEIEERELQRLRREDPATFIEKLDERDAKKAEAEKKAKEEESRTRELSAQAQAVWGDVDAMLLSLHTELPEAIQKKTAKHYQGTPTEARRAYLDDVVNAMVAHRLEGEVAKARAKWEKEGRPALRKDVLTELRGGEQSPDIAGGTPRDSHLSRQALAEMSPEEYAQRRDEIFTALQRR